MASPPNESGYGPAHRPGHIAQLWIDAWNDRDADRLAALFAEDAEFVNVTGLWWHDREAIRKAHAYGLDTIFSESTISLLEKRVKWVVGTPDRKMLDEDGNAACVVHAKMKLEGQSPTGDFERPRTRQTLFSFTVRRTEGRWVCVSAHNTDVVPGSETNVIGPDGKMRSVSYRSAPNSS
jgi:uncharacterized protein (TIGR02246 family)